MKYQVNWGLDNEPNMWDDKPTFVCPKCGEILKFDTGWKITVTTDDEIKEEHCKIYNNPSRYSISDGIRIYHQPCNELMVQVDEPISELVSCLIQKGYATDFSCAGHNPEEYRNKDAEGAAARKQIFMDIGRELWTEQIYVTFHLLRNLKKKHRQEIVDAFEEIEKAKHTGVFFEIYLMKDEIPVYAEEYRVSLDTFKNYPEYDYSVSLEINAKVLTEHMDNKRFIDAVLDTARKRLQEAVDLLPDLN